MKTYAREATLTKSFVSHIKSGFTVREKYVLSFAVKVFSEEANRMPQ